MITIGHRSIINTFKLIFAMITNYELKSSLSGEND